MSLPTHCVNAKTMSCALACEWKGPYSRYWRYRGRSLPLAAKFYRYHKAETLGCKIARFYSLRATILDVSSSAIRHHAWRTTQ